MTDETTPDTPLPETFAEWVRINQSRLLSNVLYFHYDEGVDAIAVTDQGGFILQQSDFEQLVSEIYAWYDAAGEDFIERHNQARYEKLHGPKRVAAPPSPPKPPKQHRMLPGEVYVVRADNGLYKIGRSSNAAARIKTLTVQLPYALELVHTVATADTVGLERMLHTRFAAQRKRGEWFELSSEDVAWLLAYSDPVT